MAYQGSAQAIGFRNRTIIDPSKRKRQEAAQLKERSREEIRQLEKQASQMRQESIRVSQLQNSNDQYELQALSKFSDTLSKTLEDQAKAYIEREEYEAKVDYMNRPPEELVEDKQEVDEVISRSGELHAKLAEAADKAPNEEVADKIRSRSKYYQRAYHEAAFSESIESLPSHLYSEMETNTTELPSPHGGTFNINDPNKTPEEWDIAAAYIKNEWLKNNNPAGLSAKVIATRYADKINDKIAFQRNRYTQTYLNNKANEGITAGKADLFTQMRQGSPEQIQEAMRIHRASSPGLHDRLGTQGGGKLNAVLDIMAVYETLTKSDPYRAEEIASTIAGFQITDHPAVKPGESKTLGELFGQRGFTYKGLVGKAIRAQNAKFEENQAAKTIKRKDIKEAVFKEWALNPPSKRQIQEAAELYIDDDYQLYKELKAWEPTSLGIRDSEELLEELAATTPSGEITEEVFLTLHPSVRDTIAPELVVDRVFGTGDEVKQDRDFGFNLIKANMQRARDNIDGEKQDTDDYIRALDAAQKQMIVDAKALMDANPGMTEGQALRQAGSAISESIQVVNSNDFFGLRKGKKDIDPTKNRYYYITGEGFGNFLDGPTPNKNLSRLNNIANTVTTQINENGDHNVLINREIEGLELGDLQLNARGVPTGFFYRMASASGGRHTAFDILNAQRGFKNEPPVQLPTEAQRVDELFKNYPSLRRSMISTPSMQLANSAIEQMGGVSVTTLLRAIGRQESSNNYKATNYTKVTGNDKDPALGKYQMLWSNVKVWGPQYGMGHPGSKTAFLNDPVYQDRMAQHVMGGYVQQALRASGGNQAEAVRRAAALWYGGPDGFNNFDNPDFSGGEGFPNMQEYTNQVLQRYLR